MPDVSCELPATPCQGDVVGSWSVVNCPLELTGQVNVAGFGLGCAGGQIRSGFLQVSGTWAIDANGNISDDTVTRGEREFELAAECFSVAVALTCDRTGMVIASALGYSTLQCTDDGEGGCICSGARPATEWSSPSRSGPTWVASRARSCSFGNREGSPSPPSADDARRALFASVFDGDPPFTAQSAENTSQVISAANAAHPW